MNYTVVTTFNADGYFRYGRNMINGFLQNWPSDINLNVYAEDCIVTQSARNLCQFDLAIASPELVAFKDKWRNVPKANGDVSNDPVRSQRKDAGKGYKWDAVRFAHKVYSVAAAAKVAQTPWLIWMDADMVCHSPITAQQLDAFFPSNRELCFLGRTNNYTECGLYGIRLDSANGRRFVERFQQVYDQGQIFDYLEWHDSFVFDQIRREIQCKELDWCEKFSSNVGHPLINSAWGAYLDHLKGARKELGRSKARDLITPRTEVYWQ